MPMFTRAIVRTPGKNYAQGLTSSNLGPPSYQLALAQHKAYCCALEAQGLQLTALPPNLRYPDGTFVEDVAVIFDGYAVLTRPGAPSRQGEIDLITPVIQNTFGQVERIEAPGTLEGGDICQAGDLTFIGISARTNPDGARKLASILAKHGRKSSLVDIREIPGLLHLKSALAYLGDRRIAVTHQLAGLQGFAEYEQVLVEGEEGYAANCINVNNAVILPAGFPQFQDKLEHLGYKTISLQVSEFQKMDGGLSCLSLRF